MTTTKPILNFSIDPDLLKRTDDFRYKHRFPNRAAAVKSLITRALAQGSEELELVDTAEIVLAWPKERQDDTALFRWACDVVKKRPSAEAAYETLDTLLEIDPGTFPPKRAVLLRMLQDLRARQGSAAMLIWLGKLYLGQSGSAPEPSNAALKEKEKRRQPGKKGAKR